MTVIVLPNPHNLGANHASAKAAFNITSLAYTHILLYCSIPDTSESGAKAKTEYKKIQRVEGERKYRKEREDSKN